MGKTLDKSPWMPDTLGHYQIVSRLGHGGMGDIYKAVQRPLNRIVALKVLPPQLSHNDEFQRRFETEAKAISMLQHQNIVSIFEYGREQNLEFFAMQFVEGEDLGKRILHKGAMPLTEIIDTAKQICRGLRYAHEQNVIHRDIKPQNILIDKDGVCRLSDFGIAKIFQQKDITMTGMAVGTPEYMSPEQAEGKQLDLRTDIYSLGVVLYEMLTKNPPFTGRNPVSIAYKQVHELPVLPSVHRKDTPKRLELIVMKSLKKSRDERYGSAAELLADLDTVDIDERAERSTVSAPALKRKKRPEDNRKYVEKRITDRRSGDRRHFSPTLTFNPLRSSFWAGVWHNQHVSLILVTLLAIAFILHLIGHP